jgi:hypothetical protein
MMLELLGIDLESESRDAGKFEDVFTLQVD